MTKLLYPVCLDVDGRTCLVVGGGSVACRKVRGLLACGARVRVISPALCPELGCLAAEGRLDWQARPYQEGDLEGAFLVLAATGEPEVQEAVFREAQARGVLVNVADVPSRCTFTLPAVVRSGDLTVAVATGGKSPALAKRLRQELTRAFGPEYAELLRILGAFRQEVLAAGRPQVENEEIFTRLLHHDILDWMRARDWERLAAHFQAVLGRPVSAALLARLAAGLPVQAALGSTPPPAAS
ncbi:MAG: bifunctional precorrin-2 dehydrogenase/sirohydrochlorin ferrochelatase [Thermodesulfobacteriota bacterium]